ncbi:MAG: GxxExxY protein [Verrucomicrobiota bacterium]
MSDSLNMTIEACKVLTGQIVDAAFQVHQQLGAGLLESVYEKCLKWEIQQKGLHVESQYKVPIFYKNQDMGSDLKIDLFIENAIIVEIKSLENLLPIHKAQLITYLKLTHKKVGQLINFNVPLIRAGISRIVL